MSPPFCQASCTDLAEYACLLNTASSPYAQGCGGLAGVPWRRQRGRNARTANETTGDKKTQPRACLAFAHKRTSREERHETAANDIIIRARDYKHFAWSIRAREGANGIAENCKIGSADSISR